MNKLLIVISILLLVSCSKKQDAEPFFQFEENSGIYFGGLSQSEKQIVIKSNDSWTISIKES